MDWIHFRNHLGARTRIFYGLLDGSRGLISGGGLLDRRKSGVVCRAGCWWKGGCWFEVAVRRRKRLYKIENQSALERGGSFG